MASNNQSIPSAFLSIAATSVMPPAPIHGEKSEKICGIDLKRWQQKILFYLTTLNLVRFLKEDVPSVPKDDTDTQKWVTYDAWEHSDFLCRNYVLNGLDDSLYNVYSPMKMAKKFVVSKFLDYKMLDSNPEISEVQELQIIMHEIHAEGMTISESFQDYLKHKREEMGLEDLIVRLRIEEDNRMTRSRLEE
ncbi:hypothetical protein CDL12_00585 [Handroanthus impetiginosus]|uniref:Uncharacterized protein n=1 Tax=Handroanthus impetiginosus TaxID=429701 RepID=A0A2G9IA67_9LAMI|nr:hypothetical protein CDL12_00585 [Handroanthus impetiginosus]